MPAVIDSESVSNSIGIWSHRLSGGLYADTHSSVCDDQAMTGVFPNQVAAGEPSTLMAPNVTGASKYGGYATASVPLPGTPR